MKPESKLVAEVKNTESKTATAVKNQESDWSIIPNGSENGHEWVDLGLSVKWATCNLGADRPEKRGNYFSWGETTLKASAEWSNYRFLKIPKLFGASRFPSKNDDISVRRQKITRLSPLLTKYNNSDGKTQLDESDDAARVSWGGRWRMPTEREFDELLSQCSWTWTNLNEKNGYKVTGRNGNCIFFPAAGHISATPHFFGESGSYWSSSRETNPVYARCLSFQGIPFIVAGKTLLPVSREISGYFRFVMLSVRPVTE